MTKWWWWCLMASSAEPYPRTPPPIPVPLCVVRNDENNSQTEKWDWVLERELEALVSFQSSHPCLLHPHISQFLEPEFLLCLSKFELKAINRGLTKMAEATLPRPKPSRIQVSQDLFTQTPHQVQQPTPESTTGQPFCYSINKQKI
jgi:hypothetical protein